MSEAIAQKLEEACALIEKGWCQGGYTNATSLSGALEGEPFASCCSIGAIGIAKHAFPDERMPEMAYLHRAIFGGQQPGEYGYGDDIADWNDAPERTQAEVVAAFKKAAKLARGLK